MELGKISAIQFKTHLCSLIHLFQFPNILCDNYHNWHLRQLVYICNLHLVYGHIGFLPLHQFCHMCSLQLKYKLTFNTIITLQIFTGLYRVPVANVLPQLMGFTWTFPRNQDATVKLKSELISIKS